MNVWLRRACGTLSMTALLRRFSEPCGTFTQTQGRKLVPRCFLRDLTQVYCQRFGFPVASLPLPLSLFLSPSLPLAVAFPRKDI